MVTNQLDIRATPDEVFEVLADGWNYTAWVVGAKAITHVDAAFPLVGSRFGNRVRNGFRGIDGVTEVVASDRPRTLRLRASVGQVADADISFALRPIAGGTLVTMHEVPVGDRPFSVIGRWTSPLLRVRNAETLWRLKSVVEERSGREHVEPSVGATSLPGPLATFTARFFAAATVLRGRRGLHPRGELLRGTAIIHPAGAVLGPVGPAAVAVRLSRGIGLPYPLPDFNGIAVRFLDAHGNGLHQDLLLTTASGRPILRHMIHPSRSFASSGYSSVLPYRHHHGGLRVFRCEPIAVETLEDLVDRLPLALELQSATPLGAWERVATLTLDHLASEPPGGIRYDPWNTSAMLTPAGFLNRLRAPAYAASRGATPAVGDPGSPHADPATAEAAT